MGMINVILYKFIQIQKYTLRDNEDPPRRASSGLPNELKRLFSWYDSFK